MKVTTFDVYHQVNEKGTQKSLVRLQLVNELFRIHRASSFPTQLTAAQRSCDARRGKNTNVEYEGFCSLRVVHQVEGTFSDENLHPRVKTSTIN